MTGHVGHDGHLATKSFEGNWGLVDVTSSQIKEGLNVANVLLSSSFVLFAGLTTVFQHVIGIGHAFARVGPVVTLGAAADGQGRGEEKW